MIRTLCIALVVFCAAALPLLAQQTQTTPPSAPPAVPERDSGQTREQLYRVLERYPPEVGRVLKLDPTLLRNESWLAAYPALASFVAEHPEVLHSPTFYLQRVRIPADSVETGGTIVWGRIMEAIQIFATIGLFLGAALWFVRTIIEHKRWGRMTRMQAEVHTKLIDRLTSNEELLAYMQTTAGKKFLESAPIQLDAARSVSAPVSRILWSVQIGLVVAAMGIGLQLISNTIEKEMSSPMFALGILSICIGAGFVLSAFVSFLLSRRFGLLDPAGHESQSESMG